MILAAAVMLFQVSALPPKASEVVVGPPDTVAYAENIPAPAPFGTFAPVVPASGAPSARFAEDGIHFLNLPDNDGTNKTPKTSPVFPDASTQFLAEVHIPDHIEPLAPLPDKRYDVVRSGHKWFYLAIAQSSAATFDAWTTNRAVGQGHTELNPFMRPAAGSPAIYAAIQAGPLVFDFLGRKMQRSENPFLRRMWWLPQTLSTAASLGAGIHNLAYTH